MVKLFVEYKSNTSIDYIIEKQNQILEITSAFHVSRNKFIIIVSQDDLVYRAIRYLRMIPEARIVSRV